MNLLIKSGLSLIIIYKISIFTWLAIAQPTDSERQTRFLSTVEDIINNEQFVLQESHPTQGMLSGYTCVFESPHAVWTVEYCNNDDHDISMHNYWYKAMSGVFSVKNTNTELSYYLEQNNDNVYEGIRQNPEFFITQPLQSLYMSIHMDEIQVSVTFDEEIIPFLQNMAKKQKKLIKVHGKKHDWSFGFPR